MEVTIIYGVVGVAVLGAAALSLAPRLIRSLLTPSLAARRTIYTPEPQRLRSSL